MLRDRAIRRRRPGPKKRWLVLNDVLDNRYVRSDLLGGGGIAKVFLTHDQILGRDVGLKILREQYAEDEELVERLRREATNVVRTNFTLEARLPEREGRG